jgi:hypothetical protein
MITDRVTEVFDRQGNELGWEHVQGTLRECAAQPLSGIASRMIRTSEEFGLVTMTARCCWCAIWARRSGPSQSTR